VAKVSLRRKKILSSSVAEVQRPGRRNDCHTSKRKHTEEIDDADDDESADIVI
jgi:hypothetical protein